MHKLFSLVLSLVIVSGIGTAHADFVVPALRGGVNDYAKVMDPRVADRLSQALQQIHAKGGPQVAVLTVDTIGDLPIEDAAIRVAREWKLGTESKDNGLLLLVAKSERKVRIEVGQGVEGDITDAVAGRIIDHIIVPAFRRGSFTQGIVEGVDFLLLRMDPPINLQDELGRESYKKHRQKSDISWLHIVLILLFFVMGSPLAGLLGLASISSGRGRGGWGGGGFGGGGGGWSGGGGGFSGGGSSGSW